MGPETLKEKLLTGRSTSLAGQTAIITGGYGGIGFATAVELSRRGVVLALLGRDPDRLQRAATSLGAEGPTPLLLVADVRDPRALESAFDVAHKHWGRLDILINAAGLGRASRLLDG